MCYNQKHIITLVSVISCCLLFISFTSEKDQDTPKPWNIPEAYESMENPFTEDEDLMDIGKSLYKKHCVSCHGSEGLGDGAKADELETYPGDFTADEYWNQRDGHKYFKSFIGRDEMPNFEKKITNEEDRWALIMYINSLYDS